MKFYTLYFRSVDKEHHPIERYYAKRPATKIGTEQKIYLNPDCGLLVSEKDIKNYWDVGGGVVKLMLTAELDDALFAPTLSEPDFVDEQIKSRKNGDVLGYQG